MTETCDFEMRLLEGRQVNVALRNGSRIDDCQLVSTGRNRLDTLWLFANGEDLFVPRAHVIEIWQSDDDHPWAA